MARALEMVSKREVKEVTDEEQAIPRTPYLWEVNSVQCISEGGRLVGRGETRPTSPVSFYRGYEAREHVNGTLAGF